MALERILTIGAFGFTEATFFAALVGARVDLLVDIRQRRAVRGAEYGFVNHQRLVAGLSAAEIGYRYEPSLAPTDAVRAVQHAADAASGVGSRARTETVPEFAVAYRTEVLDRFDVAAFVGSLDPGVKAIAFFCVEHHPAACHRSIVAARIGDELGLSVEHLVP